jgi:hypothetical protein
VWPFYILSTEVSWFSDLQALQYARAMTSETITASAFGSLFSDSE